MFLKNAWYVAAEPLELSTRPMTRTLLGERLVLFRTESGQFGALADRCPHRLVELSLGKVVGEHLRCAYHGAEFRTDGTCAVIPGQNAVSGGVKARSYATVERHGYCWVWMGDPESIPEKIVLPPTHLVSGAPGWIGGYGHFESMKVDYRLLNDNLIDITHAEFVHPESFGGQEARYYRDAKAGEEYVDRAMTFTIADRAIHFRVRIAALGDEGGPLWRKMLAQSRGVDEWPEPIDFTMDVSWFAPSYCSFTLSVRPQGQPDADAAMMCNIHSAVPESATTTHYFYRSLRNYGDEVQNKFFQDSANYIFGQDKPILESQQRLVGNKDLFEHQPLSFRGDRLPVEARRILERMIRAQDNLHAQQQLA